VIAEFLQNPAIQLTNGEADGLEMILTQRYLAWLEQQSQMHISTIDSLAYDLFKQFGTDVGFGRDLSIKNLERDRK
jgi:hypothetical protein